MNSKLLENLLIPVTEGLVFNKYEEENINELSKKKALIIFTTDDELPFGGVDISKYTKKYGYTRAIELKVNKFITDRYTYQLPSELKEYIDRKYISDNDTIDDIVKKILDKIEPYIKKNNELVVLTFSDTQYYGAQILREYPVIIIYGSMIKSFVTTYNRNFKDNLNRITNKNTEYERMYNKIPKELFIKNKNFSLFHVSPNKNIKELIPRISTKRLYNENIRIPRISAAPSIDACFRAVGLSLNKNDRPKTYYVYKLRIDQNTRIVKPSTDLVPDQPYTNEYWILDPIKVDLLGYIVVSLDKKNNKLKFDDSNMPKDPMITTSFVKY